MGKENKRILKFHNKLYSLENLKKAIKAYGKIAKFKIIKEKKYAVVEIKALSGRQDENIGDEFKNYALFLIIQSL